MSGNNKAIYRNSNAKGYLIFIVLLAAVIVAAIGAYLYVSRNMAKPLPPGSEAVAIQPIQTITAPAESYDVIVAGTDPEGVAAAVSAARNGQKTLLVDGRDREILGGLMTLGWLNSLDMSYAPTSGLLPGSEVLNQGIFMEWYKHSNIIGDSFDVNAAANAFHKLAEAESNLDILLKVQSMEPVVTEAGGTKTVTGLKLTLADGTAKEVAAKSVIDATQDADIAAAAGAPYTYGREDIGDPNAKMAVTRVFRLKNVTPDIWNLMVKRMNEDDNVHTGGNEMSIWGYTDMKDYPSTNPEKVVMRGLNIGRQFDDTILINALQIFNVDVTDPASKAEAFEIAEKEVPLVVEYMKKQYPEFAGIELDALAPELYVRETRHMIGEYRLTIVDVLENRDQWDRIGYGSYPVDIQRLHKDDHGAVVGDPLQYAVPFRSIVPKEIDGLLVVGRAASFDTLPHGSARVIPVGMATGQAAGAAAKLVSELGVTFRELSASKEGIAELQKRLNDQGMVLKPYELAPLPFMKHKAHKGLQTAMMLGLAYGAYDNEFYLDDPSNQMRFINLLLGSRKAQPEKLAGNPYGDHKPGVDDKKLAGSPLDLETAARMIAFILKEEAPENGSLAALQSKGYVTQETINLISDKNALTNGDTYLLIHDVFNAIRGAQ